MTPLDLLKQILIAKAEADNFSAEQIDCMLDHLEARYEGIIQGLTGLSNLDFYKSLDPSFSDSQDVLDPLNIVESELYMQYQNTVESVFLVKQLNLTMVKVPEGLAVFEYKSGEPIGLLKGDWAATLAKAVAHCLPLNVETLPSKYTGVAPKSYIKWVKREYKKAVFDQPYMVKIEGVTYLVTKFEDGSATVLTPNMTITARNYLELANCLYEVSQV